MAFKITDFTRSVAPTTDYPSGDTQDNPNGTLINRNTLTDMWQFFQKLMRDAGITPNSLPDNVTNGYQLLTALDDRWNKAYSSSGITFGTIGANTWANFGAPYYNAAYKIDGNEVALSGVVSIAALSVGTPPVLTLPAAARPANQVELECAAKIGGTRSTAYLTLTTAGVLGINSAGTSAAELYLDSVRYRIL